MKKIFTLLFALGTFAVVQAQPGSRDRDQRQPDPPVSRPADRDRDNDYQHQRDIVIDNSYGRDDRNDSRISPERRKQIEIARINRNYEFKVQQIRNNRYMSRFEKQRQLRLLQDQRQREISRVHAKYRNNRGRYDDRDFPENRHY